MLEWLKDASKMRCETTNCVNGKGIAADVNGLSWQLCYTPCKGMRCEGAGLPVPYTNYHTHGHINSAESPQPRHHAMHPLGMGHTRSGQSASLCTTDMCRLRPHAPAHAAAHGSDPALGPVQSKCCKLPPEVDMVHEPVQQRSPTPPFMTAELDHCHVHLLGDGFGRRVGAKSRRHSASVTWRGQGPLQQQVAQPLAGVRLCGGPGRGMGKARGATAGSSVLDTKHLKPTSPLMPMSLRACWNTSLDLN